MRSRDRQTADKLPQVVLLFVLQSLNSIHYQFKLFHAFFIRCAIESEPIQQLFSRWHNFPSDLHLKREF